MKRTFGWWNFTVSVISFLLLVACARRVPTAGSCKSRPSSNISGGTALTPARFVPTVDDCCRLCQSTFAASCVAAVYGNYYCTLYGSGAWSVVPAPSSMFVLTPGPTAAPATPVPTPAPTPAPTTGQPTPLPTTEAPQPLPPPAGALIAITVTRCMYSSLCSVFSEATDVTCVNDFYVDKECVSFANGTSVMAKCNPTDGYVWVLTYSNPSCSGKPTSAEQVSSACSFANGWYKSSTCTATTYAPGVEIVSEECALITCGSYPPCVPTNFRDGHCYANPVNDTALMAHCFNGYVTYQDYADSYCFEPVGPGRAYPTNLCFPNPMYQGHIERCDRSGSSSGSASSSSTTGEAVGGTYVF